MGKSEAASVPWEDLEQAIKANPYKTTKLCNGKASQSLIAIPSDDKPVKWITSAKWTEDTTNTLPDIISLVLWIREPLYRTATPSVRRVMEMEEAAVLLNSSEEAWKTMGGKQRGWVRKHLEEDLRQRSAGGDPQPDFWDQMRTTRRTANLVDYVAIYRGTWCAFWWPSTDNSDPTTCTLIPTSGGDLVEKSAISIVQLNCVSGNILLQASGDHTLPCQKWLQMPEVITAWIPPASAASTGSTTVAQIQDAIRGMTHDANALKGSRQVLWNRLQWLRMEKNLVR
jgi:hypothetical protein